MKKLKEFTVKYWQKIRSEIAWPKKILFMLTIFGLALAGYLIYAHYTQVLPDAAIYFLNDAKTPQKNDRVLVFTPHPDDETLGAGGFIYDAEKNGAEVKVVLATDGNKHGLRDQRYAEFRKATADLGVKNNDLVFLGHHDGQLSSENQDQVYAEFKREVDNFHPDFVLFTSPQDSHPDHADTGRIAEKVLKDDNYQSNEYEFLIHADRYPQPKSYRPNNYLLPPSRLVTFDKEWQRYLLSSETENQKLKAVTEYKSQLNTPILRSVIYALIRKNELFSIRGGN